MSWLCQKRDWATYNIVAWSIVASEKYPSGLLDADIWVRLWRGDQDLIIVKQCFIYFIKNFILIKSQSSKFKNDEKYFKKYWLKLELWVFRA